MSTTPESTTPQNPLPANIPSLVLGVVGLALALGASLALAQDHLGGWDLPGCGEASPCAELSDSVWGKLPGTHWPVSFVGAAYFAGALLAWLMSAGRLPNALKWLARLGVLCSLFYIGVMIVLGKNCPYCTASHAGNFTFLIAMEFVRPSSRARMMPWVGAVAGFLAVSVGLGMLEAGKQAKAEADRQTSISNILSQPENQSESENPVTQNTEEQPQPGATSNPSDPQAQPEGDPVTDPTVGQWQRPEVFTGRHRLGPEEALLRIVTFSSFQCKSCAKVEEEVMKLLEKYPGEISFSMKQFPMSTDCNPYSGRNMHPNSCWASRASEAAAVLYGENAFWEIYEWLFARHGGFTNEELTAYLNEKGYDRKEFIRVMSSDEILPPIQADIREGYELGLISTPMIFINGHEFKGWNLENGLTRTVEQLLAAMRQRGDEPQSAANDVPPLAIDKFVNDFRTRKLMPVPPDQRAWSLGPEDALVHVILWGDYQDSNTSLANRTLRAYVDEHPNVRFSFRHFPVNSDCNPHMNIPTKNEKACRMAVAAEAAGELGGQDAFWAVHDWLLSQRGRYTDEGLQGFVAEAGLDPDALLALMDQSEQFNGYILDDVNAGRRMLIRAVPLICVNGRVVGAWQRKGDVTTLVRILDTAAEMELEKQAE
jgi:protein-disulfide isomerase/uncharacterized membrane protein